MPSRVIRGDDLLESERYMALPSDGKVLFLHLCLIADDFGLVSLAPLSVRRRCFKTPPSESKINKWIKLLADVDLVRTYVCDGVVYAFIPRFRQRMKAFRSKCPLPPPEIYESDKGATELFNQYKHEFRKVAPSCRGKPPDSDLKSISKGEEGILKRSPPKHELANQSAATFQPTVNGVVNKTSHTKNNHDWAQILGIEKKDGEADSVYLARLIAAKHKHVAELPGST